MKYENSNIKSMGKDSLSSTNFIWSIPEYSA